MKKLSILLSTINDRIYDAEKILRTSFDDSEFVVVHQLTEGHTVSEYQHFYEKFVAKEIRFLQQYEKGTGRSRNFAMANANAEYMYLCDDDLIFKPDFYKHITDTINQFPNSDIFTFKIETTDFQTYKNYPAQTYIHTLRTCATVSIVEMLIKNSAFKSGKVKFDERFGLGTLYNTGEEFVMLTEGLKKGLEIRYIPEFIVQHPPVSSGKIYNKTVAFDKGAMIAKVYGWRFLFINAAFALRKFNEYKNSVNYFSFIFEMYKGSFKFFMND